MRLRNASMVVVWALLAGAVVTAGVPPVDAAATGVSQGLPGRIEVIPLLNEDGDPLLSGQSINDRGQVLAADRPTWLFLTEWALWEQDGANHIRLSGATGTPGNWTVATDLSERGHVLGLEVPAQPFIWRDRRATPIGGDAVPDDQAGFVAINRHGSAVGVFGASYGTTVLWRDGQLSVIADGAKPAIPVDINDRNHVLINQVSPSDPFSSPTEAALWTGSGRLVPLGSLDGTGRSTGIAVNKRGLVAGESQTPAGETHVFVWHRGTMVDLGTLGGDRSLVGSQYSWPIAVGGLAFGPFGQPLPDDRQALSDRGHVVGVSRTADGDDHAFLWWRGEMTDLGTLGGATSYAHAVNDRGQVVGTSETADGVMHAFLWEDGHMTDLGALTNPADASAALDINNRGQIVGSVRSPDGPSQAVMWII